MNNIVYIPNTHVNFFNSSYQYEHYKYLCKGCDKLISTIKYKSQFRKCGYLCDDCWYKYIKIKQQWYLH